MSTDKLPKNSLYRILKLWEKWRAQVTGPNSWATQKYAAWQWYRGLNYSENSPIDRVKFEDLNAFVNTTEEVGRSTRNTRLAMLRTLFKFAVAEGHTLKNPAALVKIRMRGVAHALKEKKRRLPVTEKEFALLMEDADGFERYAIALAWWTGMRLSDIACLEWASYEEAEGMLTVWTQKRDTRIQLDLTEDLYGGGAIVQLLAEIKPRHATYVFPAERAIIMDVRKRSAISVGLRRHFDRCGVEGKSIHCLRHSFASRLKAAGVSIEDVAQDLGHTSTRSTEIYTHDKPAMVLVPAETISILDEL